MNLPQIREEVEDHLIQLTEAIGLPRNIVASQDSISDAWDQLPKHLSKIPEEKRDKLIGRLCVATATGLFDSSINYIWNASVISLKKKVENFGLPIVSQILEKPFDKDNLDGLRDSELLDLCLQLNLIDEESFFYLDKCRDIRNNFSAAHPAIGDVDETELIAFISRCVKYALSDSSSPKGVDINALINSVKDSRFDEDQLTAMVDAIDNTHDAQRVLIVSTLHGISCDPTGSEHARLNAVDVCKNLNIVYSDRITTELINRHQEYAITGKTDRLRASQNFFRDLGIVGLLADSEQHKIISNASRQLYHVHQSFDNFYNEPPFAENLLKISKQVRVPESILKEYVTIVVTCYVGNPYGVSTAAVHFYREMIQSFSQKAISIMLDLPDSNSVVGNRIRSNRFNRKRFISAVDLLDPSSITGSLTKRYNKWASVKISAT